MVEIFKTNIEDDTMVSAVKEALSDAFPEAKISFDLDDKDKVLRIEDVTLDPVRIISILTAAGILCKLIPDKICASVTDVSTEMAKFWENAFRKNRAMWGEAPTLSSIIVKDFFLQQGIKDILIPGFGYGRNASPFIGCGMSVSGIEISKTAIDIANSFFKQPLKIFYGSVTEMPFDESSYDGIFCHGLLYLLDERRRNKMLHDCYRQLQTGGWMVFTVISKASPNYGMGKKVAEDTFEIEQGGRLFFYDRSAVTREFGAFGVTDIEEIEEPCTRTATGPGFKFFLVKCYKPVVS